VNTRYTSFTEVLSGIVDNRGRTCPVGSVGIPLIATNCVKNDGLYPRYETERFVDEETYATWFRGHPEPGDILFVCKGSPGNVAVVPDPVDFCIAQDMVAVRADRSKVHPRYLFAALRSPDVQAQISTMHVGTMIPHFKKGDFGRLMIPMLDESAQKFVGDLYFELSSKIESNNRLKAVGIKLISTELCAAENSAWESISVSDLADFVNGGAFTKDASGSGRMVIRIAELNSGPGPSTIYNDIDVPETKLARPGDLLMSWSGSLGAYLWSRPEAIINQHIFKVVCSRYPKWLVYDRLLQAMPFFRQTAADKATTMGHIKRQHLDDAKVRVPPAGELLAFKGLLDAVWDRVVSAELETLELMALRDALLPEMLSGRLRAPAAGKSIEGGV